MPFSLADVLLGGLLPAAAAALVWALCRRLISGEVGGRLANAAAFVAAVHAGYWMLGLGRPVPASHWEWLPWMLVMAVAGAVPATAGTTAGWLLRGIVGLIVAMASSTVLVPDWDHLQPSRAIHLGLLSVVIVAIDLGLEPLTRRIAATTLLPVLAFVLVCEAGVLAAAGSLRFAQIAGCGTAALAGMALAASLSRTKRTAEGIALPFAVLAAGMMLIGRVNSFSDVPLISYLLPPLAPLALWLTIVGPSGPAARTAASRDRLLISIPVVLCLLAVGLAAAA